MDLVLKFCAKNGATKALSLSELLEAAGIDAAAWVEMHILDGKGRDLEAYVSLDENEYPGMTIDGYDENNNHYWLANVDMPNEDYGDRFQARLYAGREDCEYDGPVAIVNSKTGEPAQRDVRKKIIYIDTETAEVRAWNEKGPMPEHGEILFLRRDID